LPFDPVWLSQHWPWLVGGAAVFVSYIVGKGSRGRNLDVALEQRLAAQERALGELLSSAMQRNVEGERRTAATTAAIGERLSSLGRQQEGISRSLSALQGVLDSKQARGAFGEAQLERLVADLLPSSAYRFQAPLGKYRTDCLITLPWPPGPVAIDAKFPLEGYQAWQACDRDAKAAALALKRFQRDVALHVSAIQSKYICPGETADFALMFLPSEAVFAALHADCRPLVEVAHRARVFPVSPSTLWPLLNTLSAALRDVHFAKNTGALQAKADALAEESAALADQARRVERDWSRLAADLQALIGAADALASSGRAFGGRERQAAFDL
jgi:DNA recombination protein RmuC